MAAYRRDFDAIAEILAGGPELGVLALDAVGRDGLRAAFAAFADTHAAASIRRCWSTWNSLCDFLTTGGLIEANPMRYVGRPKAESAKARALEPGEFTRLLAALAADDGADPRAWPQRDRALILTGLLAGLRREELIAANLADLRPTPEVRSCWCTGRETRSGQCRSRQLWSP